MPPPPLGGVVIDRQRRIAVRTDEPSPVRMAHPHVHPPINHRQLDPIHLPRSYQSQQMAVQIGVAHEPILPPTSAPGPDRTHAKPGSAVLKNASTSRWW